jgi:hypothetical protein
MALKLAASRLKCGWITSFLRLSSKKKYFFKQKRSRKILLIATDVKRDAWTYKKKTLMGFLKRLQH